MARLSSRAVGALVIVIGAVCLAGAAVATAAPSAATDERARVAGLERSRQGLVARDRMLERMCRSGCAAGTQDAVDDLRQLDAGVLPAIDGAIARLRSGREPTLGQQEAILGFAGAEAEAMSRLRDARRSAAEEDSGDRAYRIGEALGQLIGTLLFIVGLPVLAIVGVRKLVRRRAPG